MQQRYLLTLLGVAAGCLITARAAVAQNALPPPALIAQPPAEIATDARAQRRADAARRLLTAYPDALASVDGNALIWRDGTRMPLDDGLPAKSFAAWLRSPDLKDMVSQPYPAEVDATAPPADMDPGRARNAAFFRKMYGDCRAGEVIGRLKQFAWLPSRSKRVLQATTVNGVADKLAQVSSELDTLPPSFDVYLLPPAGTYNCRSIAGAQQASAHGYGIAIDIAVKQSNYWRWSKPDKAGHAPWRNSIPIDIVHIFERHGFIWGGRWSHFDTMHFEYRPELLLP